MKSYKVWMAAAVVAIISSPALALDVKISVKGEQLAFEPPTFEVTKGEKVNLTFVNPSKSMSHNWVLGKPGTEAKIGGDSQNVGEKGDYVSTGPEVIAHTKMVKPTKSEKISFNAPSEIGKYPYLCTFPGHWIIMKGVMSVVEKKK